MVDVVYFMKGCSETVEERAQRLLYFELGTERTGSPVTVATMFARLGLDPIRVARHLMRLSPACAVDELALALGRFRIGGEACPAPHALARAALAHAGRAV